jgi:uncharacterized membrane protein
MFVGMAFLSVIFNLFVIAVFFVFALKLLNRLSDIAEAQRSAAKSQAQLVEFLCSQNQTQPQSQANESTTD